MAVSVLNLEELRFLYLEEGRSDAEIARMFGMTRSAVTRRRLYHNIEREDKFDGFEFALVATIKHLQLRGHTVENKKMIDKYSPFDLLVDNHIKIKVFYSSLRNLSPNKRRSYKFSFTSKAANGNKESKTRIQLKNGRFRRLYRLTCDYLVCMGHHSEVNDFEFWIIPSADIPDELQALKLTAGGRSGKYLKYEEAWELLNEKAAP
ncbi:hypothetical protein CN918_25390 [Priestia megaterium]|nr:hypothetical protein CN918_25390 [Priestia megaterium]